MRARIFLLLAALVVCRPAAADWPVKPIRMVVPFPVNGPTDIVARIIAPKLANRLGQKVIVENVAGDDGITGSAIVAKAPPDGYTLLLTPSSHVLHPGTYRSLPFDTEKDFAPVSLLLQAQYVLVVNPSIPVDSVAGLVAYSKAHPGKLHYASPGLGGPSQLAFALFDLASGANFTNETYVGGAPALEAVASNEAQAMIIPLLTAVPMITLGRVNAIAVTGRHHSPILPELPTVAETLPGYSAYSWFGVLAPAGTPQPIVDRLGKELDAIVHDPDTMAKFSVIGGEPVGGSPKLLGALIREEIPKWKTVAREAGILIQ